MMNSNKRSPTSGASSLHDLMSTYDKSSPLLPLSVYYENAGDEEVGTCGGDDGTCVPVGWQPYIDEWGRYASTELNVVDLLKATLILRLRIALQAAAPGMSIIGTPKHFKSYWGHANAPEGSPETRIGPDLIVLDGDGGSIPEREELDKYIVTVGDIKVSHPVLNQDEESFLPGTNCYESWLVQPSQCCMDLDIPFGFLLTNYEIVFFHLPWSKSTPLLASHTRLSGTPLFQLLSRVPCLKTLPQTHSPAFNRETVVPWIALVR
ncbi:hypothetical protein GQX73_g531 [Xylaria multiplex]|uniref:Uncharacterized protein n=1 Tax=Xylaria multiplex TaxID=323545 RepID=A0A7C8MXL5_9PEZI|nr:hypothetical protein GQX73_g531 [Xylaria multiplex]